VRLRTLLYKVTHRLGYPLLVDIYDKDVLQSIKALSMNSNKPKA